jgi:hypothetical protein
MFINTKSWGSSVSIVTDYGLDNRGSGVWFLAGAGNFSLLHCIHTSSGAHPASHLMGAGSSFSWHKVPGAWSWLLTSF